MEHIPEERGPLLKKEQSYPDEGRSSSEEEEVDTARGSVFDETPIFADVAEPLTLSWEGVNVYAPPEKPPLFQRLKRKYKPLTEPKAILQNVNGVVHPGNLQAIIGASGCGKTVLLNVLTRRNLGKLDVKADIRVNGQLIGKDISKISAYVQQQDAFIGTLKVREHLWFQAQLRLGGKFTNKDRQKRVDDVIAELGLTKRSETLIGIPGKMKTLSGGERRRLLFASEILTNPLILFCDEPTTGLDSYMAQSVVQMLRNMAARGRTILCTIHQPASEVYAMFDQLLLLADGRVAFSGSTKDVLPFFGSVGFPCPANYNPADFFIHTLAMVPGKESEHFDTVKKLGDAFEHSVYMEDVVEEIKTVREGKGLYNSDASFEKGKESTDSNAGTIEGSGYHRNKFIQLRYLFWRAWLQQVRDPVAFKSSLLQVVVVGLFVGVIYLQQTYDQYGVQNIDGALFMMQMMMAFNTMFAVLAILPGEYMLFRREYQDRMYGVDMYYLSHMLTEIPVYAVFLPSLFLAIVYWMIGLYPGLYTYLVANLTMFLICLYALGLAHLVSTMTSSIAMSLSILPLIRNILTIFGGYFINSESVPWLLTPLEYVSAFTYSNEVLVVNQWTPVDYISCDDYTTNTTATSRCLTNGIQVIGSLSFSANNLIRDYAVLVSLYFMCELGGIFILYQKARKLRR